MRVPVKDIISSLKQTGNVSLTARTLGISRPTVYRWNLRAKGSLGQLIIRGIQRKSTKPHIVHYKLSHALKEKILLLKNQEHIGPKKITGLLPSPISHMTIYRYLEKKIW